MNKRFQARHGLDNNNQTLINVSAPVNPTDAVNKEYVDSIGTTATNAIPLDQKGAPNGVATLDAAGLIPTSQLPSYVDEVLEFPSFADFPMPGQADKIYVATDVHKVYRWSGSEYIDISASAGTADEAVRLATPREIALNGGATGTVLFDGSSDVVIDVVVDGSEHAHSDATAISSGFMSASDKSKLDTVELGANNYVLPEATSTILGGIKVGNHLSADNDGTLHVNAASSSQSGVVQLSSSVASSSMDQAATPFAVKAAYDLANAAIPQSTKGVANGVATLDSTGHVPASQLPSYVDDVLEFSALGDFPTVGETGKIYVAIDTSKIYRWSGTVYIEISPVAGNADSATKLATPRLINGVQFDGTADITIEDGTKIPLTGGTLSGPLNGTDISITTSDTIDAASHYYVETGSDGYIRPKTLANVRSEICTSISNDTTTNATYYPVFATGTSGAMTAARVANTKLTFNPSTGDLSATNFNSLSDINYKENIKPVQHAVDTIQKMNGYSYDWKDGSGSSYGVIAQELIEILPNAVTVNDGKHAVNYSAIIPFLIEAIKEQQREIEQLKAKLQ